MSEQIVKQLKIFFKDGDVDTIVKDGFEQYFDEDGMNDVVKLLQKAFRENDNGYLQYPQKDSQDNVYFMMVRISDIKFVTFMAE